jgi:hypothetical protein
VAVPDFPRCLKAKFASRCRLAGLARDTSRAGTRRRQEKSRSAEGSLAAASPANRPEAASTQLDTSPAGLSTQLSAILSHFRQKRQEHAAEELRAREFLTGA